MIKEDKCFLEAMQMPELKNKFYIFKHSRLQVVGVIAVLLLALLLLLRGNANSNQAFPALVAQVYFDGEYRVADGQWQEIVEGQHIPATKGDVTLRGNFHMLAPNGEYAGVYSGDMPIALYTDHINLTFCEGENEAYVMDMENPLFGDSACGVHWTAFSFAGGSEGPIEILIHNPHSFGNETAIDKLLANLAFWSGLDFEKGVLESGEGQRDTGLFFMIVALVLIGVALFSTLIHNKNSRLFWLLGMVILFAGIYFTYSAEGVFFWSDSVVSNTILLGSAMIFYMLFLSMGIVHFLDGSKKAGAITVVCLGVADALAFVAPLVTDLVFYDTWVYWAAVQLVVNLILIVCLVKEYFSKKDKRNWLYIGAILPLIAFGVDLHMTGLGVWKGGTVSKYVFIALFAVTMVAVLRIIPRGINAAEKAKELELQRSRLEAEKNMVEAELKESRVAIMLSQIQPHFIYNTLGTIERMCLKDPQKANELVRNFSLYLRGNFSELDSVTPIRFTDELKHVEYYANIEKVRFPDMNIEYDVEATEFVLPALSVQPLVENAIKHGLMRLETGGTVVIRSYETPTHFCVEVKDDGVGFDTRAPIDEKKHVGLRNIRGRLKAMVDGELMLESKPGAGTRAVIMIPKEVTE
jgi:signal transduction histidine kinase